MILPSFHNKSTKLKNRIILLVASRLLLKGTFTHNIINKEGIKTGVTSDSD